MMLVLTYVIQYVSATIQLLVVMEGVSLLMCVSVSAYMCLSVLRSRFSWIKEANVSVWNGYALDSHVGVCKWIRREFAWIENASVSVFNGYMPIPCTRHTCCYWKEADTNIVNVANGLQSPK